MDSAFAVFVISLCFTGMALSKDKNATLESDIERLLRESQKPKVNEAFQVKLLTYIIGTPDEIANILDKSDKNRKLWDPQCEDCTRLNAGQFALRYGAFSEKKEYLNAMMKGSFLVVEKVNDGEQVNIFHFQKVENKPFIMRVTYYGQVTPK